MTVKLTFTIDLESDYHVSAGHGLAAEADSALLRDSDGVPVLRGTTLVGLLRDGLWQLLQLEPLQALQACQASGKPEMDVQGKRYPAYCGQFEIDAEECPICRLFGTPRHPKRWHIHSARPLGQGAIGPSMPGERASGQIVHRVRVHPGTRRAESQKLFSQEDGDSNLTFQFTATCLGNDETVKDEAALLIAAARFVRQLGRSRRRGQGECLFSLKSVEGLVGCPAEGKTPQQDLLEHFEQCWLNEQQRTAGQQATAYTLPTQVRHTRLRLVVRADEPLLIAERAEAGNQFESRPAIPGAAVRGAFAWLAARRHRLAPDEDPDYQQKLAYQDFVAVFVRGGVQFPCLYPARYREENLYPSIPAPLDWLTCKVFPGLESVGMHGAFKAEEDSEGQLCPKCGEHLKSLGGFVNLERVPTRHELKLRHEMHIRINPASGRVRQGDLFTYVALEAGQYFVGELIASDTAAWARFCALTGLRENEVFTLHLGKANHRGYGRVTAWLEPLETDNDGDVETWIQLPIAERVQNSDGNITLTLLTDAIVTDTWGRYPVGFEAGWLARWLELPSDMPIEVVNAFAKVRPVDGFNAHLGLPRWRDIALTAGSVAYIRRPAGAIWPDDWRARLARAEREGIGLRRHEGFGRIAFNHPLYRKDDSIRRSAIELPKVLHLGGGYRPSFEYRWRERLDGQADTFARLCRDAPFAAVARWLHTNQNESPADLKARLADLGQPGPELIETIGKDEYGARDKPNRLIHKRERVQPGGPEAQEREKEGLGLIYILLQELEAEDSDHWRAGILMLADWVAGAVAEKGERA